jgi:glutathionylspermidine synthase
MMNRIPSWQDEGTRNEERLEVIKYAQRRIGFSEEEIANASDARAIELLYKAWKWDSLQEKKPSVKKRTRKAPKMAKAGQPKTKAQVASRSRQQAMDRLNKEKSVDAAVKYLMGQK